MVTSALFSFKWEMNIFSKCSSCITRVKSSTWQQKHTQKKHHPTCCRWGALHLYCSVCSTGTLILLSNKSASTHSHSGGRHWASWTSQSSDQTLSIFALSLSFSSKHHCVCSLTEMLVCLLTLSRDICSWQLIKSKQGILFFLNKVFLLSKCIHYM